MGGGKGAGAGSSQNYYGSIAAVLCAGPVDELVSVIMDGKVVWPKAEFWDATQSYTNGQLVGYGGRVWKWNSGTASTAGTKPPSGSWVVYSLPRGVGNPTTITVEGYGMIDFYWGTESQTLLTDADPKHPRALFAAAGHPPYRRQCWALLWNYLFGLERVSAPNMEFVLRRKGRSTLVSSGSNDLDSYGQANPVAAECELLTDPVFGTGLAASRIGSSASSEAGALATDPAKWYVSPEARGTQSVRAWMGDSLAYRDGFATFDGTGVVQLGRWPRNQAPPTFTAANTVNFHAALDEISWDQADWAQTWNQVLVRFTNAAVAYKGDAARGTSAVNRSVTGEPRVTTIERPWIMRDAQARQYAQEFIRVQSERYLSGRLTVRSARCKGIKPGTLFLLTHDAMSVSVVCKCLERTLQPHRRDRAGAIVLRFESDRNLAPLPYQPTQPGPEAMESSQPDPEAITLHQWVQPPPKLTGGRDGMMVALAARRSAVTTRIKAWLRKDDATGFYELGSQTQFAVYGTLAQAYVSSAATASRARTSNVATLVTATAHGLVTGDKVSVDMPADGSFEVTDVAVTVVNPTTFTYASTGSDLSTATDTTGTVTMRPPGGVSPEDDDTEALRVTLHADTVSADLATITEDQTADAVNDTNVMVWVFSASDPKVFEIMALKAIRVVGAEAFYRLKVRRGRCGTQKRSWSTGDRVFILHRAGVVAYEHEKFAAYSTASAMATFRLQSANLGGEADLSDTTVCPDITYTFGNPYAPTVVWESVKRNGTEIPASGAGDFSTEFNLTDEFTVTVSAADANGDLVDVAIEGRLGSLRRTLYSHPFAATASQRRTVTFKPSLLGLDQGDWKIWAIGRDASGRVTEQQMTPGGGGSVVTLKLRSTPGGGAVVAPTFSVPEGPINPYTTVSVTISTTTASATIEVQTTDIFATSPTGTWNVLGTVGAGTGTLTVRPIKPAYGYGKRVWARTRTGSGPFTYSGVVDSSYWIETND